MPIQTALLNEFSFRDPYKRVITQADDFQTFVNFLVSSKCLVFDYETSGLEYYKHAQAVGIGLASWDNTGQLHAAYVPFRHATGEQQLDIGIIGPAIKQLLENPETLKIAHNIKFEDHFSRREGWRLQGPRFDTMIAARLYDENRPINLESRAATDLGLGDDAYAGKRLLEEKLKELAKQHGMKIREYKGAFGYQHVPITLCGYYGCCDVQSTGGLAQFYTQWGLPETYKRIWTTEMLLTEALCDMEQQGMPVDVPYLQKLQARLADAKEVSEKNIKAHLGHHMFNLGSDNQLRKYLIQELRLPLFKKTKAGAFSVDVEVLEYFSGHSPVLDLILEWRKAEKIFSTYTQSILDRLDDKGFVHGDLQQVGTNTGRLSCKSPNYQNFPSDDNNRARGHCGKDLKEGGVDPWSVRRAFIVEPDKCRIFADYSQIELRVLAYYSKDPVMMQAYLDGEDIHDKTASEVSKIVGKELPRRIAKIINFGLSYGLGTKGLSRDAKIPEDEAEKFMYGFFQQFQGIPAFRKELCALARRQQGHFRNIWGRSRRLPELFAAESFIRGKAERRAIGTCIQGTASELTKESIVRIWQYLKRHNITGALVNTVHDEIQLDVARDSVQDVAPHIKRLMEDYPEFLPIPIVVDLEYAEHSWADKKPLIIEV
jgi:DNA polymerase-1